MADGAAAEREISCLFEERGGHVTDALEREIYRQVMAGRGLDDFGT